MTDRCYCVFEGGGAKGIAHVGALAALEESRLDLCGFAGTSAGAVIAALAAVGYRSRELICEESSILDMIDLDTSNIWSGDPFRPAKKPNRLFGRFGWWGIVAARNHGFWILLALLFFILVLPTLLVEIGVCAPASSWWLEALSLLGIFIVATVVARGMASLKSFERGLNQLLRLKVGPRLAGHPAHQSRLPIPVTFENMKNAGFPPLRVVAANISSRELRLFSHETTPELGVASAVAASVCLPVIFKPWKIAGHLHLDGGLVSNLPAWAFDPERALDRDAWTAVVQVGDKEAEKKSWGVGILWAGILTGIFGAGLLNVRNVERLKAVRIKVTLGLLQFDPGLDAACDIVQLAKLHCLEKLVFHLRDVPQLMTAICERIQVRAVRVINQALRLEAKSDFAGRLRVSLLVPTKDDPTSISADFQHGFSDCTDERIRLPMQGSFAGQALDGGDALYLDRRDPTWSDYLARPQDRWLRKLVWPEMRWVFCVPYVNEKAGIKLVASIDSDTFLDVEEDIVDVIMGSISDDVITMLDQFLPEEAFVDGSS